MRLRSLPILLLVLAAPSPTTTSAPPDAELWPSGRGGHAMAYDASRGVAVLMGGDTDVAAQTVDSTWLWSGSEWRVSASSPGWRTLPALAWDSRRQRIVLLGGLPMSGRRQYAPHAADDTWEWDGVRWERRDVAGPGPVDHHAMAYDEARGVVVMQGGASGGVIHGGGTWTYDGTAWRLAADSLSGPGQRVHHAMTYDSRRERVVLYGGFSEEGDPPPDVWEWDGRRWENITPPGPGPGPRRRHRLAYDVERGVVVLYGDSDDTVTWTWDGARWRVASREGPPPREMHAMTYDARRGRVVLYGGNEQQSDLWEWDGARWTEVGPQR